MDHDVYIEHVISIFLSSPREIRLGGFGLLVIYSIFYFGVVFDLVFQTCNNYRTYVFSNYNHSLIKFLAVFCSMPFFVVVGRRLPSPTVNISYVCLLLRLTNTYVLATIVNKVTKIIKYFSCFVLHCNPLICESFLWSIF